MFGDRSKVSDVTFPCIVCCDWRSCIAKERSCVCDRDCILCLQDLFDEQCVHDIIICGYEFIHMCLSFADMSYSHAIIICGYEQFHDIFMVKKYMFRNIEKQTRIDHANVCPLIHCDLQSTSSPPEQNSNSQVNSFFITSSVVVRCGCCKRSVRPQ